MRSVTFHSLHEPRPGSGWQREFRRFWPAYRRWSFASGKMPEIPREAAVRRLRRTMPELLPTYRALLELAGPDDEQVARFLTLYRPPAYLTGCSQAVWLGDEPVLVRNYDYTPRLWEALLLSTCWNGRRVMAMSDCLWGALDGINEAGLAVSLSFGGRRVVGDGFGSPLILRYLLEFCETTRDAAEVLRRVPTHMAYNVTVVDAEGQHVTAHLAPDRPPALQPLRHATNHQDDGDWPHYVDATGSVERERLLQRQLEDGTPLSPFVDGFLQPPLHSRRYDSGHGTLYTAVYYPVRRSLELLWPDGGVAQTFERFDETPRTLHLDGTGAP